MSELELKPCPFCGNPKPYLHQEEFDKTLWIIMCRDCHSEFTVDRKRRLVNGRTYTGELLSNHDDVIDVWNRRADDVHAIKHGHWIEEGDIQICSECGEEHSWQDYRASYCDTCGAKMDGEGGESNGCDD